MRSTILVPTEPDAPLKEEHPLIDIDHTVWIQLLLFFVVAFIASRLVFRPYLRMRDERTAGIEGARDEGARLGRTSFGRKLRALATRSASAPGPLPTPR